MKKRKKEILFLVKQSKVKCSLQQWYTALSKPKKALKSEKWNISAAKSENFQACKFYEIVNQTQEEGKQAASEKKQAFVSTI